MKKPRMDSKRSMGSLFGWASGARSSATWAFVLSHFSWLTRTQILSLVVHTTLPAQGPGDLVLILLLRLVSCSPWNVTVLPIRRAARATSSQLFPVGLTSSTNISLSAAIFPSSLRTFDTHGRVGVSSLGRLSRILSHLNTFFGLWRSPPMTSSSTMAPCTAWYGLHLNPIPAPFQAS